MFVFFLAHSVKAAIKSVQDKINSACEKLEIAHRELDEKVWTIITQCLKKTLTGRLEKINFPFHFFLKCYVNI